MIRYKLTEPPPRVSFPSFVPRVVFVTLRTTKLDELVEVELEGPAIMVMVARDVIKFAADVEENNGFAYTTARRFMRGLSDMEMQSYSPEVIEGHEILAQAR